MYKQFLNFEGLPSTTGIIRIADNACIPNNPANTDWQAYQVWLSEGGVPLPPDA